MADKKDIKIGEAYNEIIKESFDQMFDKWIELEVNRIKEGKRLVANFFRDDLHSPDASMEVSEEELVPVNKFKIETDRALSTLFFDNGKAIRELYYKVDDLRERNKEAKEANLDQAIQHTGEDGDVDVEGLAGSNSFVDLYPQDSHLFPIVDWITDAQMEEWKKALEKQGILISN